MGKKSKGKFIRATYLSIIALAVYVAVVGLVTYALFRQDMKAEGKIEAGDIAVTAQVVSTQGVGVNSSTGLLEDYSNTTVTEINETTGLLFNMGNIAPTCYQEVTIKVSNIGDIAIDYSFEIASLTYVNNAPSDTALAEQIKITVSYGENFAYRESFALSDYQTKNKINLGSILKSANDNFKVKAEFVQGINNSDAENGAVKFSVLIRSVQKAK